MVQRMVGWPILVLLAFGGSCSSSRSAPQAGTAATWSLASDSLSTDATSFVAGVVRLACSGGSTGDVGSPTIERQRGAIVITFAALPLDPNMDYPCPANDTVSVRVDLGEAIGTRQLIDGGCRAYPVARATAMCAADGVRWSP